ncbi:MAG: c-type cytochrome [Nitrospinota bacterium]
MGSAARVLLTASLVLLLPAPALAFTKSQVERGLFLFQSACARCHGADGRGAEVPAGFLRGVRTPPLLGRDTLPLSPRPTQRYRKVLFRTAEDIFRFLLTQHPPRGLKLFAPASYWALIALFLERRGHAPDGRPLNAETAARQPVRPPNRPAAGQGVPDTLPLR